MKITVDRLPKSLVTLDIAADPEEFADAVDKTMREVTRDASIPGFRKGKAPRHIIERMIGRDLIVAEAGRNMMDDLYRRALEEEDLQPLSEPQVDIYNNEPIAFKVVVEVFPTVELGDYKSVRSEPREVEIDDDDVEAEIEALRKNQAEWVDVEEARQPGEGEQVLVDLEVFEGDEHFQPPATDAVFVLGESNLFDAMDEALKMMLPGTSSELTLAFEEDDETVRPSMRGKTLRYAMTLKQIRQRDMPEFNDEFAGEVGEFETVEELREAIAEDVLRNKALAARTDVYNDIIDKIVETCEVQVPDSLVNSELDDQMTQLRTRLAQQGVSFEDYLESNDQSEEGLREELTEAAERRVRNTLVLQEVAKAEGMEITDEDLDAEIELLVAGRPNPDQLRTLYRSDYFRGMLENELHDRKLMELVVDLATEGQGAITGAGATLLESDAAPPVDDEADVPGDPENGDVLEAESAEADASADEAEEAGDEVAGGEAEEEDSEDEAATTDEDDAKETG